CTPPRGGRQTEKMTLRSCDGWQPQLHKPAGIQISALPADGHVEMGTSGSSRAAAQSDGLAALHVVALFHFEFGQMQVEGEQALAVIEHDEIALEIERPSEQHRAVIHGRDGSPAGDTEIQAQVGARGLAVEYALR